MPGHPFAGVEALVCQLQRCLTVACFLGHLDHAVGALDREAIADLGQRGSSQIDHSAGAAFTARDQDAELITSEAVGAAVVAHAFCQLGAHAGQEGVPGWMPVRVVVLLEAVEIKQSEGRRTLRRELLDCADQVGVQSPAVAQPGERIGRREIAQPGVMLAQLQLRRRLPSERDQRLLRFFAELAWLIAKDAHHADRLV